MYYHTKCILTPSTEHPTIQPKNHGRVKSCKLIKRRCHRYPQAHIVPCHMHKKIVQLYVILQNYVIPVLPLIHLLNFTAKHIRQCTTPGWVPMAYTVAKHDKAIAAARDINDGTLSNRPTHTPKINS